MDILIRNGRVLDPATQTDEVKSILVKDGKIADVNASGDAKADRVIDASGCYVMPGLIDLHVHLRDPGQEYKETIQTGTLAAAHGGYTTVCPMPNTSPSTDSPDRIRLVKEKAEREGAVNVLPVGAVTLNQMGQELADIQGMAEAGAIAVSEDGKSVMNTATYFEGMKLAAKAGIPVMAHCEDKDLVGAGCLNEGEKSRELGLPGIPNAVEDVIVARDIILAKAAGCRLHLCHCSTEDSVLMVKVAKEQGLPVTAEVCPHHFAMTEDAIPGDDANYKMNPPLRSQADVQALKEGLRDGIMDVISTDHAPHHADEKKKSIKDAPFGIVGSETAVALTITHLVDQGYLTPLQMAEKMSYNPARVIGIDRGTLMEGKTADITVIDPKEEYVIDVDTFCSKGHNTPFAGHTVRGRVRYTLVDGTIVYEYR